MGVVGFDDIALASTFIPTLTTIKQPSYQMGADAIILIDEIIKGKSAQPIHMLTQRLIFRDTTRVLNDDW